MPSGFPGKPYAKCEHTGRRHYAHGLCRSCYRQANKSRWPSERGLLRNEYAHAYRMLNRERLPGQQRQWRYLRRQRDLEMERRKERARVVRSRYGITPDEIEKTRIAQSSRCAICQIAGAELVVDHCHCTHKFRALLCRPCNLMIGYAHENPAVLFAAIQYLTRHAPAQEVG